MINYASFNYTDYGYVQCYFDGQTYNLYESCKLREAVVKFCNERALQVISLYECQSSSQEKKTIVVWYKS